MEKTYLCIKDLQNGDFAVGAYGDIEYWREIAMAWADSDDAEDIFESLKNMPKEEVIEFIEDFWAIEIVVCNEKLVKIFEEIDKLIDDKISEAETSIDTDLSEEYLKGYIRGLKHARIIIKEIKECDLTWKE